MVEKVLQLNREKTIFWTLLGVLILSVGFYIYCINVTVYNTVARQNFESESSHITLSIGSQEFEYITKRNKVTLALAYSLGFQDVSVKTYLSKKGGTEVAILPR